MIKNIIFDFDGVILDSVPIKTAAFKKLLKQFPSNAVDALLHYHEQNGGLSRYAKIKYFFEKILSKPITQQEILEYANQYSILTKNELSNSKYLIHGTINFIKQNYHIYNMHIASGADENDLHYICSNLNISQYFISINGSPTSKDEIVNTLLIKYTYNASETALIGDSINDVDAANKNEIVFFGYNNNLLKEMNPVCYLNNFDNF